MVLSFGLRRINLLKSVDGFVAIVLLKLNGSVERQWDVAPGE